MAFRTLLFALVLLGLSGCRTAALTPAVICVKDASAGVVVSADEPVVLDFGPACEGGYAAFEASVVSSRSKSEAPVLRVAYACHPAGLGEKGDFWRETAVRYLGSDVDLPILPANIDRYERYPIRHDGTFRAGLLQGLVRYARLSVETPGAAVLVRRFRLENDGVHSEGETQGGFTCSDPRLNALWRASVRTCELAAIPSYRFRTRDSRKVTTLPYLSDGAKRDRLVWSGDLWWGQRNVYYGFRPEEPYMSGSLRLLAANRTPEGYVQACPWPEQPPPKAGEYGPFPSDEFAAWFVPVLWDHHLYRGDKAFLAENWPAVRDLIAYLKRSVRADGLFEQRPETSKHAAGLAFGDTSCHHRSYMNVLLWLTYSDAARIAAELGETAKAREWRQDANRLAESVRTVLWDEREGHFVLSAEERSFWFDSNALALACGFATEEEARRIMPQLVRVEHGKFQALAVRGKFRYGDAEGALAAIEAHGWYGVLADDWQGAHLTSECMLKLENGGWYDEAHSDTALAGVLSSHLLGVEPIEPGFRKFRFRPPAACSVSFASGTVPTPFGDIVAGWRRGADGVLVGWVSHPQDLSAVCESNIKQVVTTDMKGVRK